MPYFIVEKIKKLQISKSFRHGHFLLTPTPTPTPTPTDTKFNENISDALEMRFSSRRTKAGNLL
jgi:hypothetical protein